MISHSDGWIWVTKAGRRVQIQRITDESFYHALVVYGARESVAAAAAKGLITVKVGQR